MSNEETEIRCPKCGSNQLAANKKGFSGRKAVAGAVLTGGIGLLAGTLGSNKIKITCLACGKQFLPGEGKLVKIQPQSFVRSDDNISELKEPDEFDQKVIELYKSGKKLEAVKYYKEVSGMDLRSSKNHVDSLVKKHNIEIVGTGCFVATACYGDYEAPEVKVLRAYRDSKLLTTPSGRLFVKLYYKISPPIAKFISKSQFLKKLVREFLLAPIINRIKIN